MITLDRPSERGATAALAAVLLMTLSLILIGGGVELERWRLARLELYQIADLAATAGLTAADAAGVFTGRPRLDGTEARRRTLEALERNLGLLQHDWLSQLEQQVTVREDTEPRVEVRLRAAVRGLYLRRMVEVSGSASLERAR